MHKMIIVIIIWLVLLACKSHQTIIVQEYLHRTDRRGNQHIDSKIVFMTSVECRLLNILLHDILYLIFIYCSGHKLFLLLLSFRKRI